LIMALAPDLVRTVKTMSQAKPKPQPRVEIRRAVDNGPTPERMAKADYEDVIVSGQRTGTRRASDSVATLEREGAIPGEASVAAKFWLSDYLFATTGTVDHDGPLPDGYVRGDTHTFAIARGHAAERISLVREMIGDNRHIWLVFLLSHRVSFTELGRDLWPDTAASQQRTKAKAQAALLLEMLPGIYRAAKKAQDERREKARIVQINARK